MKDQSPSPVRAWAVQAIQIVDNYKVEHFSAFKSKDIAERAAKQFERDPTFATGTYPIPLCELRELEEKQSELNRWKDDGETSLQELTELREAVKWIDKMMHLKTTFMLMAGNPVWLPEVQRHAQVILNVLEG